MPSVYIKTYGCQMNERDSEAVAAQLVAKGYVLAASEATADIILLNTCSVRDLAEQKALRKMVNLAAETRRERPHVLLGFLGCMAQSRGRSLLERLPDVDLVLGTQKFHRTAEYLEDLLSGRRERVVDVAEEAGSHTALSGHLLEAAGPKAVSAFVSIMQGCNQRCSFCIVPDTRGPERSRPLADIVAECRSLAALGVREVTLLGQIVNHYGRHEIPPRDRKSAFVQLLEAVHGVEGLERIRFTSPHPKGYGLDVVEAYGRLPKLMPSAHIPVQSGSNAILKLMRRGYTRERFLRLVGQLRQVRPDIGLCTDFIVGFPGETEADFEDSVSLLREAGFDQAYIFKYSPRKDTPAAALPGQLPLEVLEARNQRLLAVMNEVGAARHQSCVGRVLEVLIEGPSRRNPARLAGRTPCNRIAIVEGHAAGRGQVLPVKITRAGPFTLYGEPASIPPLTS